MGQLHSSPKAIQVYPRWTPFLCVMIGGAGVHGEEADFSPAQPASTTRMRWLRQLFPISCCMVIEHTTYSSPAAGSGDAAPSLTLRQQLLGDRAHHTLFTCS